MKEYTHSRIECFAYYVFRVILESCFDPTIDILEAAINQVLQQVKDIKVCTPRPTYSIRLTKLQTVVFLGQFGSSSEYLRKRMGRSPISKLVTLRHSESGKLNVVRGVISERLDLSETFVRKFQTLRSYGTLITLPYCPGSKVATVFPNPRELGAVDFARDIDGRRLKVIEWAIPKVSLQAQPTIPVTYQYHRERFGRMVKVVT